MAGNNDIEKMLRAAVDRKNQERMQQERASIVQTIGRDIVAALTPVLKAIAERPLPISEIASAIREGVMGGMKGFKMPDQEIRLPAITVPEIKLPTINVPPPIVHVTVPEIKIPKIEMPNLDNIMGALRITGWDKTLMDHPIPVQIRDADGNPVIFGANSSSPIFGGMSGGGNFPMQVLDIPNNALRVSGSFSISASNASSQLIDSSATPYSAANPLPVTFAAAGFQNVALSDSQQSGITSHQFNTDFRAIDVYIGGSFNTAIDGYASGDNRLKTDGSAVTQPISVTDIFATSATSNVVTPDNRVKVDGSAVTQPISVTDIFATTVTSNVVTPDNRVKTDGSGVTQPISGTVAVSGVTASVSAAIVDSTGVQYSGSNPIPITIVTSATATVNTAITDSGGVQYSGSNPVPVIMVAGSASSTFVVGDSAARAADNGGNPVKVGGIARTTNPTAYADGDRSNFATDKLGRQITRPLQVRDLIKTAYVSVATGTETTLLAGVAGVFLDCIMITASNNSSAATQLDIRAVTAGNIIHTMYLPANSGPIGWAPTIPWPQDATGNNWTIDMPDQTGTTVYVSALFSQEL